MNPKAVKLREEREKNAKKIASLQARNKKIDTDIAAIERGDILGMVREYSLSPDELFELIKASKRNPVHSARSQKSIDETEEVNSEE